MKFLLIIMLAGDPLGVIGPFEFPDRETCSTAKLAVAQVMQDGTVICAQVVSEISRGPAKKAD
jgi:hypothetical protein